MNDLMSFEAMNFFAIKDNFALGWFIISCDDVKKRGFAKRQGARS